MYLSCTKETHLDGTGCIREFIRNGKHLSVYANCDTTLYNIHEYQILKTFMPGVPPQAMSAKYGQPDTVIGSIFVYKTDDGVIKIDTAYDSDSYSNFVIEFIPEKCDVKNFFSNLIVPHVLREKQKEIVLLYVNGFDLPYLVAEIKYGQLQRVWIFFLGTLPLKN